MMAFDPVLLKIWLLVTLLTMVHAHFGQRHPGRRYFSDPGRSSLPEGAVISLERSKNTLNADTTSASIPAVAAASVTTVNPDLAAHNPHASPPSIDRRLTPANATGQLGSTVYLHCYVHNIGQKTVTWLRRSDYHILTVGMVTYTSDERFSAVRRDRPVSHSQQQQRRLSEQQHKPASSPARTHMLNSVTPKLSRNESGSADVGPKPAFSQSVPASEDWMLQIRGLQEADAGEYECQVNTQHPMLSAYVTLNVLSPHASIAEGNELSVVSGSIVSLTCVIQDCPYPPSHVFWYHGKRVINYDRHSRINITSLLDVSPQQLLTPTQRDESSDISRVVSRLIISDVTEQHSGRYTCAPVHATPATVHVHVLHAEEQMSRQSSSGASRISTWNTFLTLQTLGPVLAFQMAFLLVIVRTT